ncbi:disulfide bond formation protein DsbA [Deinococcus koreensis]|uniref:Disulfide bond formation protein DsbA n=1 Tax=Deinococcus koreensis TaxID=2054903 RepID=A0A2K3V2I2_9DEIO|nr:disulfide bond formation protein DsbA [Deinococcus koreensis]
MVCTLSLLAGAAQAQLWDTPKATAAQTILKGFTARQTVLTRGDATITLDVAGNLVVGVLVEAGTAADVARGLGVAWGLAETDLAALQRNLGSPQLQAAARRGFVETADEDGSGLIALKLRGEGSATRYAAYVALKIWPDSAFPATRNVTGSAAAPDVVRIFSDFQCPYCREMWDSAAQGWEARPEQFRVSHYQFPLDKHPNAFAAAEASECAGAQGRFWPYADTLFREFDRWTPLRAADTALKFGGYAGSAGLKTAAFTSCLNAHTFKASVEAQVRAGLAVGVQGTPTVFLNGVKMGNYASPAEVARIRAVTRATPSAASVIDARLGLFR